MKKCAIAPGKIILFGEHAVVYDKLGIAAAINMYSKVCVEKNKKDIYLKDPWREVTINIDEIILMSKKIDKIIEKEEFSKIAELQGKEKVTALKYLLGLFLRKIKFSPLKIEIDTQLRSGMGTSSSIFSAMIKALSDFFELNLSKQEISELCYQGDTIAHGGTPSGIDNSVVTYGGFISFRKTEGIKQLNIKNELPIVIGDTHIRAKTSEMVSMVRTLIKKDESARKAIEEIGLISNQALEAIKTNDLKWIGELMNENQEKLRILRVSTPKLEKMIKAAINAGAYGAKLTGGGGGGCMIALADDLMKVANAIKKVGGDAIITKLGVDGVRGVKL